MRCGSGMRARRRERRIILANDGGHAQAAEAAARGRHPSPGSRAPGVREPPAQAHQRRQAYAAIYQLEAVGGRRRTSGSVAPPRRDSMTILGGTAPVSNHLV